MTFAAVHTSKVRGARLGVKRRRAPTVLRRRALFGLVLRGELLGGKLARESLRQ
jgi:hypothetical protein